MRHLIIMAVLISAIVTIAGCNTGNGGPVGQGNYGTIFGTVTAAAGGKPISGAGIQISFVIHTTTDANGLYRVTSVPIDSPGLDETVVATATGYQSQTKMIHVAAAGQQYEVDFQLVPTR